MEKFNIRVSFDQLEQDKESDIQILELIKGSTSFLIAELKAGKKLPTHYHNKGAEIYHVLSGIGKMEIGTLSGANRYENFKI
jgi:mannose-6-phosphate isomerase-like protein (cupin superfamily)